MTETVGDQQQAEDPVQQWINWALTNQQSADEVEAANGFGLLPTDQQREILAAVRALDSPPPPPPPLGDDSPEEPALPQWLQSLLAGRGPLGETDMSYQRWTAPMLTFEGEQLTATAAVFVDGKKRVPEPGKWVVGDKVSATSSDTLYDPDTTLTFRNLDSAVHVGIPVRVFYELDEAAVAEIDRGEDEHCADFRRAFDLSYGALQAAVDAISERTFGEERAAIEALVTKLTESGQECLVPSYPFVLTNWQLRLGEVANLLEGHSKKRDKDGDHLTKGYHAQQTGADVTITPWLANPRRASAEVVVLAEIPIVYSGDGAALIGDSVAATGASLAEGGTATWNPTVAIGDSDDVWNWYPEPDLASGGTYDKSFVHEAVLAGATIHEVKPAHVWLKVEGKEDYEEDLRPRYVYAPKALLKPAN